MNGRPTAENDAAPCGCSWDGEHCPHCRTVCNPGGDGWSPAHTVRCHARVIPPGQETPDA